MDPKVLGVFIPIIAIVGSFVTAVYLRKFANLERMAMIDKGINPKDFKAESNTSLPLRFSLLLSGAGIGLLIAYFLDTGFGMGEIAYFSMLFLFSGVGLGVSYVIEEKKKEKENKLV